MQPSKSGVMSREDWKKVGKSAIIWAIPAVLLYLNSIIGVMSATGHEFSVMDFVPNTFTQGGITLYVLSQLQGILIRYSSGTK